MLQGSVFLNGPLDRETTPSYSLDIEAHDNNLKPISERRTRGRTMIINLLDVNDYTPRFTQPYYVADNIQENAKRGSTVIIVSAMDKDEGDNSKVTSTLTGTLTALD